MEGRVACEKCGSSILPQTADRTGGICKPCYKKEERAKTIESESSTDAEAEWELSLANAHPLAKQKLTHPFFWDITDENAPFGNDTGADTLAFYQEWRSENPKKASTTFLKQLLSDWEVSDNDWDLLDQRQLRERLAGEHFNFLTRDDAAIALAFAQLVLEGMVDEKIKQKASLAIERQMTDVVIDFRGWVDPAERKQRLLVMKESLLGM